MPRKLPDMARDTASNTAKAARIMMNKERKGIHNP
jgi:hypothetical protein